jgi:hypothetical protein
LLLSNFRQRAYTRRKRRGESGMSEEELVDAYANGRISRRVFVRHLVAGGFTLATALGYARALAPAAASRGHEDDDDRHRHRHRHRHRDDREGRRRDR